MFLINYRYLLEEIETAACLDRWYLLKAVITARQHLQYPLLLQAGHIWQACRLVMSLLGSGSTAYIESCIAL